MWTPRRGEAQVGTTPTESGELENVPKALGKSANQRLCARSYPPGKTNATRNSCFLKKKHSSRRIPKGGIGLVTADEYGESRLPRSLQQVTAPAAPGPKWVYEPGTNCYSPRPAGTQTIRSPDLRTRSRRTPLRHSKTAGAVGPEGLRRLAQASAGNRVRYCRCDEWP